MVVGAGMGGLHEFYVRLDRDFAITYTVYYTLPHRSDIKLLVYSRLLADAADLRKNLSARWKTGDAELLKVGETSFMWQLRAKPGKKAAGKV
jgi:hypothetical protein